jgi:hypothetical protein
MLRYNFLKHPQLAKLIDFNSINLIEKLSQSGPLALAKESLDAEKPDHF